MNMDSWLLFASIAFVATITPGPAILLVTTHSVSYGTRYSVVTMLGNISGLFIMSLLSVMGLSAIILTSAPIFFVVKIFGALYLICLGIKLWRKGFGVDNFRADKAAVVSVRPRPLRLYINGLLVALSNPKAIAFTTALFPQFIVAEQSMVNQFAILIITFMLLSFICLFTYAVMATETKNRTLDIRCPGIISKLFGGAFVASGLFLATASHK